MADTPSAPVAPAAPAPAPTAPAAPAAPVPSTPIPAPGANNRPGGPNLKSAYDAFDNIVAGEQKQEPPKSDTPKPEEKATPEQKQTPPTDPKAKPGEPPKTTPQPPAKAATLREQLELRTREAADWKKKYEDLHAESAKPKTDAEKETLLKEREEWNRQRAEMENEIKFSNYERSAEYKEKFLQPFANAYEQGKKLMPAISFKEPSKTDEFGTITEEGKSRKATEADWDALMSIADEDTANKFIADHFGHNAARVTLMRDKVMDLNSARINAIEDFRKQGAERENSTREQSARARQEMVQQWNEANKHAAEKFPEMFAPDPADAKGNELLEAGTLMTDLAFNALDPKEFSKLPQWLQAKMVNGKLPPHELTKLHSAVRNRSAAYDRLVYRLHQEKAARKTAEDKLAGFEASQPRRGQEKRVEATKGGKPVPGSFADVDSAFDQLAAQNA